MENKTLRIAIYARKSAQSDTSDSISNQVKIIKNYLEMTIPGNYDVFEYIEAEGHTGATTNKRPEFNRMVEDIKNGFLDAVACYKLDRLNRNVRDFSQLFQLLQDNNVEFLSARDKIDTTTAVGRAMMYMTSVFSQMERETTVERETDAMIQLAANGNWAGGVAPLGYKLEKILVNNKHHTILVKDEETAPFVKMVFDAFNGRSLNGVATYFKKNGVKAPKGGYFSSSQIHTILKNPHYCPATQEVYDYFKALGCIMRMPKEAFTGRYGIIVYGRTSDGKGKKHTSNPPEKWSVSVGQHKAILDSETWLRAQSCFGQNKLNKARRHECGLLHGIMKCKCGRRMRVKYKNDRHYNKEYKHYVCDKRAAEGMEGCDTPFIEMDTIDDKLLSILREIRLNRKNINKYIEKDPKPIGMQDKAGLQKKIKRVEVKINNLTMTLQENNSSTAVKYIISNIEELDNELSVLRKELREINISLLQKSQYEKRADYAFEQICILLDNFDTLSYRDRQSLLKSVFTEYIFCDGKLQIII